jgi:hypothetical protein
MEQVKIINEYDTLKSENKFCTTLKIYQKACLTEVGGCTDPRGKGKVFPLQA